MKQLALDNPIAQGLDLAFVGMSIVFTALVLVSVFIVVLPRILAVINPYIPPAQLHTQDKETDATAIAAAIGFALHAHRQND